MSDESVRAELLASVSRETAARLETYERLVRKWQKSINLVSPGSLPSLWQRHFVDSAQVWEVEQRMDGRWLDLGSGAGFPGMVVAILAHGKGSNTKFILVDSDARKTAFLREVARQTGVSVTIENRRIEDLPRQQADVVSARALASLSKLLTWVRPHASRGGILLFPKGKKYLSELSEVPEGVRSHFTSIPSRTDADAVILRARSEQIFGTRELGE